MAKYEKHPRIKGKYQCPLCDYGRKNGRSRQAVSKHFDQKHGEPEIAPESVTEATEPSDATHTAEEVIEATDDVKTQSEDYNPSEPEWLTIEREESEGEPQVGSIPSPVRGVLKGLQGAVNASEFTVTEMREFFKHQAKMVRYLFSGVLDPLVSWWGKGVTSNPEFAISRTEEEWRMTEEITAQWMEYRGVTVPLNPDVLMIGCVGALYVPPIRKNADPTRPKWNPLGWLTRWRQRRAIRRGLKENPLNDMEATYGLEP
jgi:hypothetical protein